MIERLDLDDTRTATWVLDLLRAADVTSRPETLTDLRAESLQWLGIPEGDVLVAAMAISGEGRGCHIDRLVVRPAARRRGLGRHLVQAVLRHEWVTVSVPDGAGPARALFESLGFRPMAARETAPGIRATDYEWWNGSLATSFDADVALYEAARPPYPAELFDGLAAYGLTAGARVLESGAGTGQATLPMLDRGARVTCVEPGPQMAARLRERVSGRDCLVIESTLEQAALQPDAFDLAVAATSFHWVDARIGIPVLARALRPGGHVALWWNVHRTPPDVDDPLSDLLTPIVSRFQTDERQQSQTYAFQTDVRTAEITAGGLLEMVHVERIAWPWTHDAASLRALFASFSDWITLPEPDRTEALDAVAALVDEHFGGSLTRTYTTSLYVARRPA